MEPSTQTPQIWQRAARSGLSHVDGWWRNIGKMAIRREWSKKHKRISGSLLFHEAQMKQQGTELKTLWCKANVSPLKLRHEYIIYTFCIWSNSPTWAKAASCSRFVDHTQWHTTVGRNTLDERSARRRDLYQTTHNTHKRQTSMPPAGFEPAIPASERP